MRNVWCGLLGSQCVLFVKKNRQHKSSNFLQHNDIRPGHDYILLWATKNKISSCCKSWYVQRSFEIANIHTRGLHNFYFILLCQVAWQPCLVNELSRCYLANELLVVIIAISIFNCFCVLTLVCFDIAATGGLDTLFRVPKITAF